MIKTGYEIIGMIKDGKAPKKIKNSENIVYEFDEYTKIYSNGYLCLDLIQCLNDEFEIIEDKVWKPSDDEEYYYIANAEEVASEYYTAEYDKLMYEIGNCFKTPEEAEKTREKLKVYTQLKRYAEEHNTEKIDFEKEKGVYHFGYDFRDKMVKIYTSFNVKNMNDVYFTSRGVCERAIKEIGEDNIKKLFEE